MFNETHSYNDLMLTFIKSVNIQAFPCGRRSSAGSYDKNNNGEITDDEKYYFPFDPEARLNTEANNRKYSSLNGFTQTYLKEWDKDDKKLLTMSLAGYLFTIALTGKQGDVNFDFSQPDDFGAEIVNSLEVNNATRIYANILLEDVHLFSSTANEYFTSILRDQYDSADIDVATNDAPPETLLDLLNRATTDRQRLDEMKDPQNYYFSGLSFSAIPLTATLDPQVEANPCGSGSKTVMRENVVEGAAATSHNQHIVSLCILERPKVGVDELGNDVFANTWQIHQPAYLPKIEHGTTEDSIIVTGNTLLKSDLDVNGNVKVDGNINATSLTVPYSGEAEGDTTEIDSDGISAPFIYANLLNADDIVVNNEICIPDPDDKTKVITKVGANITTDGNITAEGNITAKDNLNVGTPDNPATDDSSGCIVAKNNITAEQNLTAKQNLYVKVNAEVTGDMAVRGELLVGTPPEEDADYSIGRYPATIISGGSVITDTIEAKFSIDTPRLTASAAGIGTLNGNDIQQKIGEDFFDVPVMFIKKDGASYQLQLSRVNKIGF